MMTKIMGILNVTPDSFYDGGNYANLEDAVNKFDELKKYSDIIDIGAESTRPGALPITDDEEISRLLPLLKKILPQNDVEISIDTYHAKTAEIALEMGADIINTVDFDKETASAVAERGAKIVLMVRDTLGEFENTKAYLDNLINSAKAAGVSKENIILDIGIGFLGGAASDFLALKNLRKIKSCFKDFPILAGVSRKSFIGEALKKPPKERLAGSLAANAYACLNGADILRTHDAKETKDAVSVIEAIERMCVINERWD